MRLGFDAKRYLFNETGLGTYSRGLVTGLTAHFPENKYLLFSNQDSPWQIPEEVNLIVNRDGGKSYRSFGIVKDIMANRVEVYHGLSNEMPQGLHKKIPVVVTIHDVIFRHYPEFYPWLDRKVYHFKTAYAVRNAHVLVATSHATAEDLVKLYGADRQKIRVVYQTIRPEFYKKIGSLDEPSEPYFFYHSSFNRRKNHAALIEAFALIKKQTSWNLVLAGRSGDTLEICKRLIESEKLQDRVRILEDIPFEHLIEAMQNAAAFVYPSLFEGFGIPLAEAAATGLPMAVSNIPVFRELAEHSVIYFHPNKVKEIAGAMMELYLTEQPQNHEVLLNKIKDSKTSLELMDIYKGLYRG